MEPAKAAGIRTESPRTKFRKDSRRIPGAPESGSGREGFGSGVHDPQLRSRDRFFAARAWAKRNLPDEEPAFAASAFMTLRLQGVPTAEAVRARLKAQGRDNASLKEER